MSTPIRVGVIGLGIIGSRVAKNLRKKAFEVYVWNRTRKAEPNFVSSPAEVAKAAQIIQIFVSNDAAVLETLAALRTALTPDHLILIHSTISPETVQKARDAVKSTGAHLIDAPFTGSKAAAENGQLVYYVAGDKADLERAEPVLEASRKGLVYFSRFGNASLIKIATNMVTAAIVQALTEALTITERAGIDPQELVTAIENNACRSGVSDFKLKPIIARDFDPNFSLMNMLKDSRLALGLAKSLGVQLPLAQTVNELLAEADAKGWSEQDFAVASNLVRDQV
ncbi:MAG: NAD(P)-dependent oxidoreductase [Verrucomicrobia bacterium]|nr:NAD(P)-dependent oxidoreductase [Verrucomicrobiota bacterium]MBV8481305.1 NAD(P)-dependent oxidoreductase [Verrucomicrobiota bacterium]